MASIQMKLMIFIVFKKYQIKINFLSALPTLFMNCLIVEVSEFGQHCVLSLLILLISLTIIFFQQQHFVNYYIMVHLLLMMLKMIGIVEKLFYFQLNSTKRVVLTQKIWSRCCRKCRELSLFCSSLVSSEHLLFKRIKNSYDAIHYIANDFGSHWVSIRYCMA